MSGLNPHYDLRGSVAPPHGISRGLVGSIYNEDIDHSHPCPLCKSPIKTATAFLHHSLGKPGKAMCKSCKSIWYVRAPKKGVSPCCVLKLVKLI